MLKKFFKTFMITGMLSALTFGTIADAANTKVDLSFSGSLKVDAFYQNVKNNPNSSNIEVPEASLTATAKLKDEFVGSLRIMYDETVNPQFFVDEAKIDWNVNDKLSLTFGKFYLISSISDNFISDPVSLNYIELWKPAAMAAYKVSDCITLKGAV
mgnify:CR=1 FL=1